MRRSTMLRRRMDHFRLLVWVLAVFALGVVWSSTPVAAQSDISDMLSMTAQAGYDGRYRPNMWMPVQITVENRGANISGRFVVRPETTGSALPNVFSVPVDLPTNSNQSFFLYMVARANADDIRVELLDDDERVLISRDVPVRLMLPRDNLFVVVTGAANSPIRMVDLSVGAYQAYQANWSIANIPDKLAALEAVDMMVFSDIDTGTLSPLQKRALETWVLGGGHLVVTGGANWESTAAGFGALLPLVPTASETSHDMTALARFAGEYQTTLNAEFILATGDLASDAWVLAENGDGLVLAARRQYGNGTVDYVAVDPGSGQLRDWPSLSQVWRILATTTGAQPSWSHGFSDWKYATTATEILPGVNMLPAALNLTGFLLAYILLIGPLNYLILSRLNRRELAWVTMPVLIVVFTVLAWGVGFELRGNRVTLSRVSVVQVWPESEHASVQQVIGLLSPRRGDYTLAMEDDRLLRPISSEVASPYTPNSRSLTRVEIQQTNRFMAVDFPVDASFMAAFYSHGVTEKPEIGGQATLAHNADGTLRTLRGAVTNSSDLTLTDVVVLAYNRVLYLEGALEPGAVVTFDLADFTESGTYIGAMPSSLEYAIGTDTPFMATTTLGFRGTISTYVGESTRTVKDILGESNYQDSRFGLSMGDDDATQETRRRQAFLSAFVIDQFASTSRGNHVYVAGWTDASPNPDSVPGREVDMIDSTLYLVALDMTYVPSTARRVTIAPDQFTWVSLDRVGAHDVGPLGTMLYDDVELAFQFTPLPEAMLAEVDSLMITLSRVRTVRADGMFEVWNWEQGVWEEVSLPREETLEILSPARFIGPQNAVRVRLLEEKLGHSLQVRLLAVTQTGRF